MVLFNGIQILPLTLRPLPQGHQVPPKTDTWIVKEMQFILNKPALA